MDVLFPHFRIPHILSLNHCTPPKCTTVVELIHTQNILRLDCALTCFHHTDFRENHFSNLFFRICQASIYIANNIKKNPQSSSQPLSKRTKSFAWLLGSKSTIGYDIDFQFICNELENLIPKLSTSSVAKNCLICVYKCNVCVVLYVYSSTTPTPY